MTSRPDGGRAPAGAPFLLAIAAAALGAGAATALLLRSERAMPPAATPLDAELARLTARVDELARAAAAPIAPATGEAPRREAIDAAVANQLEQQLRQLEERLQRLEARPLPRGATDGAQPERTAEPPVDRAVAIAQLRHTVLDPATTVADKLAAWGRMRGQEGAWDDATVAEMIRLGLTSDQADVRADVWRQAHCNQRHDAMVPALLQAMQADAAAKVREEAAETLASYSDRPGVLQALELASRNDADDKVRRQAAQSIDASRRERQR